MARPAVNMLTPNDEVISFDTLDQAQEWLNQQLECVEYFKAQEQG